MTLSEQVLILQTIDSMRDIGGRGKKILKFLIHNIDEKVTLNFLAEAFGLGLGSLTNTVQLLIKKNLIIKHGKYRGATYELNKETLAKSVEQYLRTQALVSRINS